MARALNSLRHQLRGGRRFLAPYYSISLLLMASYFVVRRWWYEQGDLRYAHTRREQMPDRERYVALALNMALGLKLWRADSLDGYLSDLLTLGKGGVLLLVWFMDYRLCFYYALAAAVLYLLCPQPLYRGPSNVEAFTPASFKDLVEDAPQPEVTWLVEFYAPWAPPCIHLEPVFAELSLEYVHPLLRFGKVDASRWPQLAAQHSVQVYGAIPQLPTFIEFKGGKEVGRIPTVYEDGSVSAAKVRRRDLITAFGLQDYKQEGEGKEGKKAAGGGGKAGGGKAGASKASGSSKKKR